MNYIENTHVIRTSFLMYWKNINLRRENLLQFLYITFLRSGLKLENLNRIIVRDKIGIFESN